MKTYLVIGSAVACIAISIWWLHISAISLLITNSKCPPFHAAPFPLSLPGIHVSADPIGPGNQQVLQLPPVTVSIDAMHQDATVFRVLDIPIPIVIPEGRIASIDGLLIANMETTIRPKPRSTHTLFIECH